MTINSNLEKLKKTAMNLLSWLLIELRINTQLKTAGLGDFCLSSNIGKGMIYILLATMLYTGTQFCSADINKTTSILLWSLIIEVRKVRVANQSPNVSLEVRLSTNSTMDSIKC